MFVITNETLRLQTMKLKAFDPHGELFDGMITSEEVGAEKPDLKIFEQALKRVSAKAQDCTMIGDSLEKDVRPALQLGMKAFLTCEFQNPKEENLQGILNLKKLSDLYDLY